MEEEGSGSDGGKDAEAESVEEQGEIVGGRKEERSEGVRGVVGERREGDECYKVTDIYLYLDKEDKEDKENKEEACGEKRGTGGKR